MSLYSHEQLVERIGELGRENASLREQIAWYEVSAQNLATVREQRDELLAALQMAVRQNSHDMLMTGEELRACEATIAKAGAA